MSILAKVKGETNKSLTMTASINPGTYQSKDFYYFHSDGYDYRIDFTGHNSSLKAFMKCPQLAAVIGKKTQAFTNGKTWIMNKKGKAKDKEANGELANMVRNLMANPNPFQSQKEFEAQLYTYVQVWGWSIVFFGSKPVGFKNYKAKRMWNICPAMIDIEETKKSWLLAEENKDLVKKIVIDFGGERGELPLDACYIVKDSTVSFGGPLFPQSRTVPLEYPINNIIGAYESRGKLIDNRGALGIISPDAKDAGGPVKLMDQDKTDIQNDFLQYGMRKGQYNYIISTASIKWSQMGIATKELMLFEEVEDNAMTIADNYGLPPRLLGSVKANSLGGSDIRFFQTQFYQDTMIPESENMCEQWSKMFDLHANDLMIIKDYSHVAALQDDEQKKALARKTRNEAYRVEFFTNMSTLNQWRIANGEDPISDNFGDMYYYQLDKLGWKFAGVINIENMVTQETAQQQNQPAA